MNPARCLPGAVVVLALLVAPALAGRSKTSAPQPTPTPANAVSPSAPPIAPPRIIAPILADEPPAGKGRLEILFSGNRRWCTFPDDRPIKPPVDPRKPVVPGHKNEIFTFGYEFSVAAIKRGAPDRPLMLFESPVIQTASMMPAVKVEGSSGARTTILGPSMGARARPDRTKMVDSPAALVPHWQESDRCTTLPERFQFDLDPGVYDLYVAFDLMGREGEWGHRTSDYLTDVSVEAGRHTRLDAVASMPGGPERQLSLDKATLLESARPPGADAP